MGRGSKYDVCGSPIINLADLKKHTTYSGFTGPDDQTIKIFWDVLEALQMSSDRDLLNSHGSIAITSSWHLEQTFRSTRLGTDPE